MFSSQLSDITLLQQNRKYNSNTTMTKRLKIHLNSYNRLLFHIDKEIYLQTKTEKSVQQSQNREKETVISVNNICWCKNRGKCGKLK